MQYVVLVGNLSDGYKVVGPFADWLNAQDYVPNDQPDTHVMRLMTPWEYARVAPVKTEE